MKTTEDTIAAIATPSGRGGIGIIRVSGVSAHEIAQQITECAPCVGQVQHCTFFDSHRQPIDEGLLLSFKAPHSFTGEDVVEFHTHGSPIVLSLLLKQILQRGVRMAEPGEFSKRAFLNDKLDLIQAEAIADLIAATSEEASRFAVRSLQGVFSEKITALLARMTKLRCYVEAAIDFPEEEVDFLSEGNVLEALLQLIESVRLILQQAHLGSVIREGLRVVLAGYPNAGKSTLLNQLAGNDIAIVTEIPGTTRDLMHEQILIDGLPLHLIDTAGLRSSEDRVEQEGIKRAWRAMADADLLLLIVDFPHKAAIEVIEQEIKDKIRAEIPKLIVVNKIDLASLSPKIEGNKIYISAKYGEGLDLLRTQLKKIAGISHGMEDGFIARRRHLDALRRTHEILNVGKNALIEHRAGELLAEDLRQAHQVLSEITGAYSSDDLLGEIFSSFCIGK